ncbi:eukaryotic initiation factor 4a, putative [Leishmania panamensis]|uniref:Eukaryotic initiation factor 4a, putative n=1 Tax=Leishmania panamensis TaxID=5679 RepID=A0A088S5G3_LEIPA|nr:eukaryotic initiation factor 4a, putative [Leishmania panamensis]AIN96731.1 eukaryotic initiation factor 4a, putative [Leishmania panamensis]
MLMETQHSRSLIERERRTESVFRPPKFVKSVPPHKKALTATARPWYPTSADAEKKPLTPLRLILAPPTALGQSPDVKPKSAPMLTLLTDWAMQSPQSSLFSPLSTPVHTFFHTITEVATAARIYPVEMFMSVRRDASHTPHGVLRWCVQQYLEVPTLKVPTHLQLSMSEVLNSEDGVSRGALGSGLKGRTRAKPVRQVHHKVMSVLSRITPQKFTELLQELLQLPLRQADGSELHEVVKVFFDKAVQEPEYSELYARLFSELCEMKNGERELEAELRDRLFCNRINRELLHTCDEEFHRPIELTDDEKVDRTTGKPYSEEEVDMKRTRLKNRLVGNIKFLGELFKMNLVTERVVENMFQLLVGDFDPNNPVQREDYIFEVFSTLIRTVGPILKDRRPLVLAHYLGVAKAVENSHPRPRIRFLMMDLSDLNKRQGWVSTDRVMREADSCDDLHRLSFMKHVDSVASTSFLQSSIMTPSDDNTTQRCDFALSRPASVAFRDNSGFGTSMIISPSSLRSSPTFSRAQIPPKPAAMNPSYLRPSYSASAPSPVPERRSPGSAYICPLIDPPISRSLSDAPPNSSLPRSRASTVGATEVVNIQEVTQQLIQNFNDPREEATVLHGIGEMSLKNKVLCLTWWLRQVTTDTSRFEERQRITELLSSLLISCPSFQPSDLISAIIEWIRFDIEKAEYHQCPRMFENMGHMIQRCYAADVSTLPNISEVQNLLHLGLFNVMLHDLTTSNGTDQMVTLVKSAFSIGVSLLNTITDRKSEAATLRVALQCRFRLLPYFFSVSNVAENGILCTSPQCHTPTTPNMRNIPQMESISSVGHYDPLSQCMLFHKVTDDAEFVVLRRARVDASERTAAWREGLVSLALAEIGNGSTVSQLVQMGKVIGALLACSTVSVNGTNLLSATEVDELVAEMLKRRSEPLFQAIAAMEVIMHHTLSVSGSNPRKSIRVRQLRLMYSRWCTLNIFDATVVMNLLRCLHAPENGASVYAVYHNALVDAELPWATVLTYLL